MGILELRMTLFSSDFFVVTGVLPPYLYWLVFESSLYCPLKTDNPLLFSILEGKDVLLLKLP